MFRPDSESRFRRPLETEADAPVETPPDEMALLEAFRAEAFAAGRSEGLAETEARVAPALRALAEAAARLEQQQQHWLRAQRSLVVDLAIAIAERILGETVAVDRDGLSLRIARVLELAPDAQVTVLELCPADIDTLGGGAAELAAHAVQLVARADLSPGDVVARAGASTIDARTGALLAELRERLAGVERVASPDGEEAS